MKKLITLFAFLATVFYSHAEECSVIFTNGDSRYCTLMEMNDNVVVLQMGYNLPPKKYNAKQIRQLILLNSNVIYKVVNDKFVMDEEANKATAEMLMNVIQIYLPKELNIQDKVFLVNNSSFTVEKAVIVDILKPNYALGSCFNVSSSTEALMADFKDKGLQGYQGHTIGLKIKGVKKVGEETIISYDYVAAINARNHDLYITITDSSEYKNALDF